MQDSDTNPQRIYLDYAAATPMDARVLQAMLPYYTEHFYNPSALYEGARSVKSALDTARSDVAQAIGAKPSEIIFTAGGTESANMAVHGVMCQFPEASAIVSAIEHDAVLKPADAYDTAVAIVNEQGIVDIDALEAQITPSTVLISVMLANNEVGSIQPVQRIAQIVQAHRQQRRTDKNPLPLYLHTDACQAPLYLDCSVARLGVDLLTLNGGKIYGPKQSGILYVRSGVVLDPMITGGGQEWGLRSGTENVAQSVGFAKALQYTTRGRHERSEQVVKMRDWFIDRLESELGAHITGHKTHRLANNIHVQFDGVDNERVLFKLDMLGVDAAAGSACSASSDTSSHVLLAMGYTDTQARSSVRMSIDKTTTKTDLDRVIEALKQAIAA